MLTMWHVYGEQSDSPMNRLIEEFNQTVGMEKGIIINVTGMSNASYIEKSFLTHKRESLMPVKCLTSFQPQKQRSWKNRRQSNGGLL